MKINEIVKKTGLTKKAIRFYEQEELINPSIDVENGYRNYVNEDVKRLLEITLFRQLDMSIKDIQLAYQDPYNLNALLEAHKASLEVNINKMERNKNILNIILNNKNKNTEEVTNKLKFLSDSIALDAKEKGNYIRTELLRLFPGAYGKMYELFFSPFFNIKIDTKEKEEAWLEIIKFLDNTTIEYPQGFEEMFNSMPDNFLNENKEKLMEEMNNILNMSKEELKVYIKKFIAIFKNFTNDEISRSSYKEKYQIGLSLKESLLEKGFYDVFFNNFSIISEDFKKLHYFIREIQNQLELLKYE